MPICIGEIKLMRLISRATPCGIVAHMSSDDASGMLHAAAIAVNSSAPLPLGIGQNAVFYAWCGYEYPQVSARGAFARASVASK